LPYATKSLSPPVGKAYPWGFRMVKH